MPDTPGSLGIAISEAVEAAVTDPTGETRYSLGSVLNHVMLHQTIIGLEAKKQLEKINEKLPDVVIGCAGGGSNFAGISFPFILDKINGAEIEDQTYWNVTNIYYQQTNLEELSWILPIY